jgi:hypothetical protein
MRFGMRAVSAAGMLILLASLADAGWILGRHHGIVVTPATVYRFDGPTTGNPPLKEVAPKDNRLQDRAPDPDPNQIQKEIDDWRAYMKKRPARTDPANDPTLEFGLYFKWGERRVIVEVRRPEPKGPNVQPPPDKLREAVQAALNKENDPDKVAKAKQLSDALKRAAGEVRDGVQLRKNGERFPITNATQALGAANYQFTFTVGLKDFKTFLLEEISGRSTTELDPSQRAQLADRMMQLAAALDKITSQ